jgi:hypothetical protein
MIRTEHRIYDEQGELLEVKVYEVEGPTQEELIAQKEALLIQIYEEIKALKGEN